jgi:hypothetical protein
MFHDWDSPMPGVVFSISIGSLEVGVEGFMVDIRVSQGVLSLLVGIDVVVCN